MSNEQPANERHHPRIENLNLVQISTGRTLDISQGGIRLELYHPLPLRTVVSLTVALGDTLVDVQGKVVYLEEIDDERCAMGIQFIDIPDDSQRLLDDYVAKAASVS